MQARPFIIKYFLQQFFLKKLRKNLPIPVHVKPTFLQVCHSMVRVAQSLNQLLQLKFRFTSVYNSS
jgi:rhodanese-related sulfurtransferase